MTEKKGSYLVIYNVLNCIKEIWIIKKESIVYVFELVIKYVLRVGIYSV